MEQGAVCVPSVTVGPIGEAAIDTIDGLDLIGADARSHDFSEVSGVQSAAPSSLSMNVARPSICQSGSDRFGNASTVRPSVPFAARAHPRDRSR